MAALAMTCERTFMSCDQPQHQVGCLPNLVEGIARAEMCSEFRHILGSEQGPIDGRPVNRANGLQDNVPAIISAHCLNSHSSGCFAGVADGPEDGALSASKGIIGQPFCTGRAKMGSLRKRPSYQKVSGVGGWWRFQTRRRAVIHSSGIWSQNGQSRASMSPDASTTSFRSFAIDIKNPEPVIGSGIVLQQKPIGQWILN